MSGKIAVLALMLVSPVSWAGVAAPSDVREVFSRLAPGVPIDEFAATPVPGIYKVVMGTTVFYATEDGKYLFTGDLIDTITQENLSKQARTKIYQRLIDAVDEGSMIVFAPEKTKRTITVFTDVDCPYCAKFHLDVPELVEAGVKVRYLSFPRTGIGSESYKRAVAVWCADDPNQAIGTAKAKGDLKMRTCENPVAEHYRLGVRLGLRGTPTIFLDDGRMLPGYVPPGRLLAILQLATEAAAASPKTKPVSPGER